MHQSNGIIRERQLRRRAAGMDFSICKGRRADDIGYMLVDRSRNFVIAGASPVPYFLDLDDVEATLNDLG